MKIGIIAIQGAVSEHIERIDTTLLELGLAGHAIPVRKLDEMNDISALIIPGGESTTIGKALVRTGLQDEIVKRAHEGMPVMGTCAGCILLAKEGDDEVNKTNTKLLALMDMAVDRNAFGRQRESFESSIDIDGIGRFPAVFIRAPQITRIWGRCRALSKVDDKIIMAQQDCIIALSFHPELTPDSRIHRMFLEMI